MNENPMSTPNRRSDYTIQGLQPAKPINPPAAVPAAAAPAEEFDPEALLNAPPDTLTGDDEARVKASFKELDKAGESEAAPVWDPVAKKDEPVEPPGPVYCPNCSFDLRRDPSEVSLEDKQEFLRSVLANQSFTKTYKLLNGRVTIRFRARNTAIDTLIEQQLHLDLENKRFVPMNDPEWNRHYYLTRMSRLWMAASLVSYQPSSLGDLPEICTPEAIAKYGDDDKVHTHLGKAEAELFMRMPLAVFNLISTTFMRFSSTLTRLTLNAEHPNFWVETGGLI